LKYQLVGLATIQSSTNLNVLVCVLTGGLFGVCSDIVGLIAVAVVQCGVPVVGPMQLSFAVLAA
jgi:hypothetical protein